MNFRSQERDERRDEDDSRQNAQKYDRLLMLSVHIQFRTGCIYRSFNGGRITLSFSNTHSNTVPIQIAKKTMNRVT